MMISIKFPTIYRMAGLLAAILAVFVLSGCGDSGQSAEEVSSADSDDGILRVVATTTQAGDLMRILSEGSDRVEVTQLMGAGVDPHLYQPTESDVAAMNRAQMVVYSGLHLEGQFDAVFQALGERE
jgi:manganese/zinc/iron transport system substrate-binding protein